MLGLIFPLTTVPQKVCASALISVAIFLTMIGIGRYLKRRSNVHLGVMYRLFCIVISIYLPLHFIALDYPFGPFKPARELGAAALLLGSIFAIALIRRYVWEYYFEKKRQTPIPKFLRDIVALIIFVLTLFTVISMIYGQRVTAVILPSTIIVGIVGFAMQDLLGNVISGVALQLGKPFKAGDWLVVDHYHAEVIEVNWRSTRLRTNDDVYLDIPNNQIVKNTIINLSYPTKLHAMRLRLGIDYNAAPNLVRDVLTEAALHAKGVLNSPAPKIYLIDFGDSAVIYEIKFWLIDHAEYNDITDAIRTNVWYALQRHGIRIPFPIRTLQIDRHTAKPRDASSEMRAALRSQSFFKYMDDAHIDRLLSTAKLLRFGREEKIIQQGAEGHSMFVLCEGSARVYIENDGAQTLVATLSSGDNFGEMSLLTGEKRSATVIAQVDCEVMEIDKSVFAGVLEDNPELLQKLSDMLAQRRLETEGVLASTTEKRALASKEREYSAGFLAKLYSFFEL